MARWAFRTFFVLCVLGFFTLLGYTGQFTSAPTSPDPSSNRVIPWNDHGTNHFITPGQDATKRGIIAFCGVMFALTIVAGVIERRVKLS